MNREERMDLPWWAYDRTLTDPWGLTSVPVTDIVPQVRKTPEFPKICRKVVPRSSLSSFSGVHFVAKESSEGS